MLKRVIVGNKCRRCNIIPENGYSISRASRNDWLCPDCCNAEAKIIREKKRKQMEKDLKND